MNYQDILKNYKCDYNKLLDYGFIKEKDYVLVKDINNQFKMEVRINSKNFNVIVIDKDTSEEYLPFKVESINGSYVQNIRDLVDKEIDDIVSKCFSKSKLLDDVLDYILKKYNTKPDLPFDDGESLVFRVNNKWYGLVMYIDRSKLSDSKGRCIVLNLKIDKDKIPKIVDNKNIFHAYHMNKKYWISVIIDNNLDMNYLFELIDESYSLVSK